LGHFLEDILGNHLGRGVLFLKGRELVQVGVIESPEYFSGRILEFLEIDSEPDGIQLVGAHHQLYFPVVSVELFTLSFVPSEIVRRGEGVLDFELVHGARLS
jgi:hypothetical protein